MKIKVSELVPGQMIKIKGKEYIVDDVQIKDVKLEKTVPTAVITYREDNDESSSTTHRIHIDGASKVEVQPPSVVERLRDRWFNKKIPAKIPSKK
jgi:hypothetical protein